MPLRAPTTTRNISQLGLSQGGSLAKGHEAFRTQIAAQALGEQATAEQTREKLAQYAKLPDEAQLRALNGLGQVKERDILTDEEAAIIARGRAQQQQLTGHPYRALPGEGRQAETDNLPAVIRHDLIAEAGNIIPQWHVVRNLPGYLKEPIRVIGRKALNAFTKTPIEKIVVNSTLSNAGEEVRGLMRHISENGFYIRQSEKELMTFAGMFDLPDAAAYEANVRLYEYEENDFLLIKDNFGYYIYSWPTADRVLQTDYHIEAPAARGMLR